jgi:hypothetical protein
MELLAAVGAFALLFAALEVASWVLAGPGAWCGASARYLGYLIRHKRLVYREGRRLGVGRWQLLVHDWSKFTRSEWTPYAQHFYSRTPSEDRRLDPAFEAARAHHLARGKHHWEYWTVGRGAGAVGLPIPDRYVREMAADWLAMGLALGRPAAEWYGERRGRIVLHERSRTAVEALIGYRAA